MVTLPQFGRYRVLGEIGRGGMGVVYRAVDPELDREVAIKHIQLPPDASREVRDELEKRFRREAKAAARIRHPGVVAIHDVGTTDSGLYLVMELVEGESLAHRLERGAFPERAAALELAARAADALAAAHRAGVVHRDVKPANILISRDGRALLTDFGVARSLDEVSELTRTGMVVGSPAYMAPEQLRGGEVDGRADLFSLGVVLYEMLLRKRPFPAQSITTLLYQILHEDPLADPSISRELDVATAEVLRRLLAKEAKDRFADAPAVAAALQQLPLEAPSAEDAPTRPQIPIAGYAAQPHAAQPLVPPPLPPVARSAGGYAAAAGAGAAAAAGAYTPPGASHLPPPGAPPPYAPLSLDAGPTPTMPYPGAAGYAGAAPTPYVTPGAPRRTALLLVAGTVVAALVVVVAVLALWNRSPGRPVVQPSRPGGWTPSEGGVPDLPLPTVPPTPTPVPLTLPLPAAPTPTGAVLPPGQQPPPKPGQTAAPTQPAPAPTEAAPAPPAPTPPPPEPPATQPPAPPPPSEHVVSRVRARRGVEFDVSPGDAQVYLDGRLLGVVDDIEEYEITTPGRHFMRFTAPGHKPALVEVEITQDVRTRWAEVEVELEELPEPE